MSRIDELEDVYVPNRAEWRAWLAENHQSSPGIWLIYHKKNSPKSRVPYDDAVEEALCFGWIDSTVRRVDDLRYKQLFTSRKPKSTWSKLNKTRVKRLIADGLMREAGMKCIEIAKENGTWTILDAVEDLIVPDDLQAAFDENPTAAMYYDGFSKSVKKGILWWVVSAKRPETRAKRIRISVEKCAQGQNPRV